MCDECDDNRKCVETWIFEFDESCLPACEHACWLAFPVVMIMVVVVVIETSVSTLEIIPILAAHDRF